MNNTFDFKRFSLLVKRQWVENKKLFLMASVILVGLGIIFYAMNMSWVDGGIRNFQKELFSFGLFVSGTIFTNYVFRDFYDKNSSTNFLLIPASHFEKLLNGLFYVFIFFPIVYFAFFGIVDLCFVKIGNSIIMSQVELPKVGGVYDLLNYTLYEKIVVFNTFSIEKMAERNYESLSDLLIVLSFWAITQAITILGSMFFERWALIKTGFSVFAIALIIGLFFNLIVKLSYGDLEAELQKLELQNNSIDGYYSLVSPISTFFSDVVKIIVKYVATPILLLIAYFKLKEKQV
jgi:hypothetical protein